MGRPPWSGQRSKTLFCAESLEHVAHTLGTITRQSKTWSIWAWREETMREVGMAEPAVTDRVCIVVFVPKKFDILHICLN